MSWFAGVVKWFDMLAVLLWKEMMVRFRSPISTFFELTMHVLAYLLFYYLQGQIYINGALPGPPILIENTSARIAERISVDDMMQMSDVRVIYYTPPEMEPLMKSVAEQLGVAELTLISHYSEIEMMSTRFEEMFLDQSIFAVIFDTQNKTNPLQEIPQLKYKIRNNKNYRIHKIAPPFRDSEPHKEYGLIYESFVSLQMAIDRAYIELRTGKTMTKSMSLQMFPYPKETPLPPPLLEFTYRQMYPSLTINAILFFAAMLTSRLSQDKTSGIKALLKTAGCSSVLLYTSSILAALLVAVPCMIAASYMMSITAERSPTPWPSMSMSLLFVFYMIHLIQVSALCALTASILPRHHIAAATAVAILIASYTFLGQKEPNSVRGFFTLLPSGCVLWFYEVVGHIHMRGDNLSWSNFVTTVPGESGLWAIWIVMLATCIPYFMFTWYFDHVTPGEYGVPERWNFLFTKRYWLGYDEDTSSISVEPQGAPEHYEPAIAMPVGIRISNLWKVFKAPHGQKHAAVAGVSMDMYDKEITVLLGQNGAGKTTLMSIITGMSAQSAGSVDILEEANEQHPVARTSFFERSKIGNSHDETQQPSKALQHKHKKPKIGYCPQSNALMMNLTCNDHLTFFAKLDKGIFNSVKDVVDQSSRSINLTGEKVHNRASVLSGGQQRRLQLGCAIASGARTLVLDEPTSGLDPRARRSLWDILLKLRGSHTVLVSTHYMDEADVLGDRIAVMRVGQLVCYGSPMFLKRAFGTGYRLTILKTPECNPTRLQDEILTHVQGAETLSSTNEQVIFKLPSDSSSSFPSLFNSLESGKESFGIMTIGVGVTTLEEIFLKVANEEVKGSPKSELIANGTKSESSVTKPRLDTVHGIKLYWQRTKALVFKQTMYEWHSLASLTMVQIILPLVIAVASIFIANLGNNLADASDNVDVFMYPHMRTLYYSDSNDHLPIIKGLLDHKTIGKHAYVPIKPIKTDNVTKAILSLAEDDKNQFLDGSLIAAEFEEKHYNGLYSTSVYHAMPVVANFLDNILAYEMFSDVAAFRGSNISMPLISVVNEPISRADNVTDGVPEFVTGKGIGDIIMWASLVSFAVFFQLLPTSSLPVQERGGARRLIRMCGVPVYMNWLFSTIWYYAGYLIISGFIVLITWAFEDGRTLNEPSFLLAMYGLFAVYGLAGLAFLFFLSFLSRSTAQITIVYLGFCVMFGSILSTILFSLYQVNRHNETFGQVLFAISCLVPHYPLTRGLLDMGLISIENEKCILIYDIIKPFCDRGFIFPPIDFSQGYCCDTEVLSNGEKKGPHGYFSGGHSIGVGLQYGVILAQAIVFMSLVLLLDSLPQGSLWACIRNLQSNHTDLPSKDESVEEEKKYVHQRIETLEKNKHWNDNEDALICKDIQKSYFMFTKRPLQAVRGVNLATKHGECFGLLGENGAGKSSLLTILVGLSAPTIGTAYVNGTNLKKKPRKYLTQIGYCPQFDAVSPYLTGRQQLAYLLKMQGVNPSDIQSEVDKWIAIVGLELVMNKISGKYSGGQRRRLSAACALLLAARGGLWGEARGISLMDEPTAGVDPAAARHLWAALKKEQLKGASILLSTHSMHETEILCDRVGIISKGEFVVLGSTAALRAKYSWGYTATLKLVGLRFQDLESGINEARMLELNQEHSKNLKEAFKGYFPTAELKDDRQTMLQYRIFTKSLTYGDLFSQMEDLKARFPKILEDYAVSETTLEEVFLSLSESDVSAA